MSLITPYQMNQMGLTQDQVDAVINSFPITELEFSAKSSLFHRFFGVITGSPDGEITFIRDTASPNRSDTPDKFLLNSCARFAYPRVAQEVFDSTEQLLGYAFTPRYITEDQPFQRFDLPPYYRNRRFHGAPFLDPDWKFRTNYPGVERMNVMPLWTTIEGYEEVEVPVFVEEGLVASTISGAPTARISDILTQNPRDVILRLTSTAARLATFVDDTHPLTHDLVDSVWEIPLSTDMQSFNVVTDRVTVQHRKYVYIDIVPPTLTLGQTLHPVYPGTNQIIPEAKAKQVLGNGNWRYTFYVYTLVNHEFVAEDTNLVVGEFYKLYPYISFRAFQEIEALPSIIITRGETEIIVEPTLSLVNSEHGIFHLNYSECHDTEAFNCLCQDWPQSVTLRYHYRTNPDYLPQYFRNQRSTLLEAMAGKIAAGIPTDDCGCEVPYGYIKEMQFVYTDAYIDTQTKVVVEKLRHGTIKGQMNYTTAINKTQPYRQVTFPRVNS